MVSQDLNGRSPEGRSPANTVNDAVILDAARELMTTIGIRRTTMADVARSAKVSRATLYRRYPNVTAIAAAVTTQEFAQTLATMTPLPGASTRESLAHTVVHLTSAARAHPLLRRIIDLDPQFLTTYLLHRPGRTSQVHLDAITRGIETGQADGSIRTGDSHDLATVVLRAAWSSAVTGPVFISSPELLDSQLYDVIDRYLHP